MSVGSASAQESFTDRLQKQVSDQGIVVLHHDAEIDALVNGTAYNTPSTSNRQDIDPTITKIIPDNHTAGNETTSASPSLGKRVRMDGYRVQVYVGGNSRDAKYKAQQMEGRVRSYFPDTDIYTRFVSPRWVCHIGDFKTREEAVEFLSELRGKGGFSDAIVVKCKINALVN